VVAVLELTIATVMPGIWAMATDCHHANARRQSCAGPRDVLAAAAERTLPATVVGGRPSDPPLQPIEAATNVDSSRAAVVRSIRASISEASAGLNTGTRTFCRGDAWNLKTNQDSINSVELNIYSDSSPGSFQLPVARTRVRDRIVRRQEILLAAGRVFIKKGFRLASMEDIAAAAGVGVGTLYHYFKSKEHLVASLLAESTEILSGRLKIAAAKPLPPGLGLLAINRAYADYFAEYPDYFRIQMFFQHETEVGEFAEERKRTQKLARENFDLLAAKIREGQSLGIFRSDIDALAAATALWASYNGIFLAATNPAILEITGLSLENLLSAAVFLHFRGLGTELAETPIVDGATGGPTSNVSLSDLQEAVRAAPWISPAMIFHGMRLMFQPEKTRGFRQVYEYRLSGSRGGVWTIVVDDGTLAISEGAAKQASIVLEMSDEHFIKMVTGQVEAADLWMKGELKVAGDLQRAALFRTFFYAEPAAPSS